jgi:hypothetical protein
MSMGATREISSRGTANVSFSYGNHKLKPNSNSKSFGLSPADKTPTVLEFDQMHAKLSLLEGRLSSLRENFEKRKEERKFRIFREATKEGVGQQNNSEALKQMVSQVSCPKNVKAITTNPYSTRHNIYYISELVKAYLEPNSLVREHLITSFHQLKALKDVRGPSRQELSAKRLKLEKRSWHQGNPSAT